ncbi:MAG TPA: class II fructose-bisphosphate aldolase [Spirochaetota bacterium]|nr:class II fructose-bisphosphate aldolase [Spirochaetota bacterium]HPI89325.1 class II fructose-bisphosphate aldolase [Spirochaetota bacterium]HPR49242.1 class II fructose-bisphosphate aldolase [Spirochaetota bacterium]
MSLLNARPENFKKAFPSSKVLHVNGKHIIQSAMKPGSNWVAMAVNTRHEIAIPGIVKASMELDAPVFYELALSESDMGGGYTGMDPAAYIKTVVRINEEMGNAGEKATPFTVHRDHTTVQKVTRAAFDKADEVIRASILAGYGAFSIDVSFLPMEQNLALSMLLSEQVIKAGLMYESEVGEIGGKEGNSTVAEAVTLVETMAKAGLCPDLIAINNGTTHGNVRGEIDLELSRHTFEAMRPWGVGIAQHGTTGTPIEEVGKFYLDGIFKANVGTNWQNVVWGIVTDETGVAVKKGDFYEKDPGKGISAELWKKMEDYSAQNGIKGGNMKKLHKPFKDAMMDEYKGNAKIRERVDEAVYSSAVDFFKALKAEKKGEDVRSILASAKEGGAKKQAAASQAQDEGTVD